MVDKNFRVSRNISPHFSKDRRFRQPGKNGTNGRCGTCTTLPLAKAVSASKIGSMNTTSAFFVASFGLFVAASQPSAAGAASNSPILVVPASKATLHFAVDLPEKVRKARAGNWSRSISPAIGSPVQTVAKIAADGSKQYGGGRIVADIPPADDPAKPRRFRLEPSPTGSDTAAAFAFSDDSPVSLRLTQQEKPVLVYNHGVITDEKVPAKDTRRSRACYIHPLWGLNGEVLTDDFPKDHYHHHGVFWAWPHVEIGGEKLDLWMYKQIAPKFVRWLGRDTGPLAAALGVENGWFVGDRKVMIERVWIQVAKATPTARALDLDFTWIPVDRPITLRGAEGKSYGGLTIRFAVKNEKDSIITVPAGAAAKDLPETPLALGRSDLQVRRGETSQRGGDLHSSRPSELSAHLAHTALRRYVRRLAGRKRKDV